MKPLEKGERLAVRLFRELDETHRPLAVDGRRVQRPSSVGGRLTEPSRELLEKQSAEEVVHEQPSQRA
jgi:hypothetical protein